MADVSENLLLSPNGFAMLSASDVAVVVRSYGVEVVCQENKLVCYAIKNGREWWFCPIRKKVSYKVTAMV